MNRPARQSPRRSGRRFTRRELFRAGLAGTALAGVPAVAYEGHPRARALIWLMLVGGPSQLETLDPKPDAPTGIRGPFGSIATRIPGVRIGEHLPRLARRLGDVTLVRSLHHTSAPIHETGHQLLQTGHLLRDPEGEYPHLGSVVARCLGPREGAPPFVMLPGPIGHTGVAIPQGQTAGRLGESHGPWVPGQPARFDLNRCGLQALVLSSEPASIQERYGHTGLGRWCLQARRLVEAGTRVVVVNMYRTVFESVSWDVHGRRPFSTFDDYAREVLPAFDQAVSALILDLKARGLLDSTLVAATGEFGRSPRINASGGRDHWPGVWSGLLAGAGVPGGRVVGSSDAHAAEPVDRPVTPPEWLASLAAALGIRATESSATSLLSGGTEPLALGWPRPVPELIG